MSKEKVEFKCKKCGSNKLGYQKYAKCITPVSQENGNIKYSLSEINENDYLCVSNGFICMTCKSLVEYCGLRFETEKDLLDYFKMDPGLREQQQKEYEEQLSAMIDAQAEQENADEVILDDLSNLI